MNTKQLTVHCLFSDGPNCLAELLEESFRLFLRGQFALSTGNPPQDS